MTDGVGLAQRIQRLHTALLADALDKLGFRRSFLGPEIRPLTTATKVVGTALPMRAEVTVEASAHPYDGLFAAFEMVRPGDVMVISADDQVSGLWGELLTIALRARGGVGAVTSGLTRDVDQIIQLGFPVFARGCSPLDSAGRQEIVVYGEPMNLGDALIRRGDWVVGDSMGVVVVPYEVAEDVVDTAEAKDSGEVTVRDELGKGSDLREVFDRYGVL